MSYKMLLIIITPVDFVWSFYRTYFQAGSQYMYRFDRLLFMPAEITGGLEYLQDKPERRERISP